MVKSLPGSPSESLQSKSSSVKRFRQLWWSPKACLRCLRAGMIPSDPREKHSDSYVSTDTIEALTTVKVKCVRFTWHLSIDTVVLCHFEENLLKIIKHKPVIFTFLHEMNWWTKAMFSDPLPPPGLCQRCRSWKCRGQRAGRRSRGRAPQTLRLWPTCKAERKRSRDRDLQPVWLWERAWKSHWRSRRCLEYRTSGENIQMIFIFLVFHLILDSFPVMFYVLFLLVLWYF